MSEGSAQHDAVAQRDREGYSRLRDALIVALMLAVVTFLHTFTEAQTPTQQVMHDLFRRLYYIPILYASFAFGVRGGLITATASTLLFFPHAQAIMGGLFGTNLDNLFEIVLYFVMGGLFGWLRDADAKRTAELSIVSRRLESAYRTLEDRAMRLIAIQDYTQSILRSVTAGVVTVSPDGSIATLNPAAEQMLETGESDAVARPLSSLLREGGGLADDVARVLAGGSPRTMRELRLVTCSGRTLHAQTAVSRMLDTQERGLGAVVTLEDVSQVKLLTEQLVRADRLAALGELTAGVAHEVRNPLGVIRASVQLMEESDCSQGRLHEASDVIKQEIDRLDRVVKSLLDFGRPSTPSLRAVDIRAVLEEVVLFTRQFADRGNVSIEEDISGAIPEVMADPEQLKQVFVNLIANAVQAMSDGGGTLTVTTGADDGFVYARFTDTGPGIPGEVVGKVFDPFFSTRDDGTGLGLTIVHRIVDEHDGHIEVATDQGRGTAFTVFLPVWKQEVG